MGLFPKTLHELASSYGIPRPAGSKAYIVDFDNGDDDHSGLNWARPMKTVAAAEDKCVGDRHDVVFVVATDSADTVTEAIVWDKDFTHLIGLGSDLPGVGQRCRIQGGATVDVNPVITISGKGCIFRNLQIFNGSDAAADSGAVVVTANRCYFENVFFYGMGHTTPAARAAAFSLKLTGAAENHFKNCTIGGDTVIRAAANSELIVEVGSSKNTFDDCKFMSHSATAGKFLVHILTSTTPQGLNSFKDCLFYNNWTNWGGELTHAFNVTGAAATYYIDILRPRLVGVAGVSDVATHFYLQGAAAHADSGIAVNPA